MVKVPPPTVIIMPPTGSPTNLSTAQRLWAAAKIAGPAFIAVAALVISLATYENQQSANSEQRIVDQATAVAARHHDAEQVSVDQQFIPHSPWTALTVQNDSTNVISGVEITVQAIAPSHTPSEFVSRIIMLYLGSIPACSIGIVDAFAEVQRIMRHTKGTYDLRGSSLPNFTVEEMIFTDPYETTWSVQPDGFLQQISGFNPNPSGYVTAQYHTVGGCTSSP